MKHLFILTVLLLVLGLGACADDFERDNPGDFLGTAFDSTYYSSESDELSVSSESSSNINKSSVSDDKLSNKNTSAEQNASSESSTSSAQNISSEANKSSQIQNKPASIQKDSIEVSEGATFPSFIENVGVEDESPSEVSLTITKGNVNDVFGIDNNGNLTLEKALDFETQNEYKLTIQLYDGVSYSNDSVVISVNNVDEPPKMKDTTVDFDEDKVNGSLVLAMHAADPEGYSIIYSIDSGSALFTNSGKKLLDNGIIDYETGEHTYVVRVVVSDGLLKDTARITINIKDIDGDKGTFTDSRDTKEYNWKQYGNQYWMTENLNYAASSSVCYNGESSQCQTYGRLYNWVTAMQLASSYETNSWNGSDVKHQGVCPEGWYMPSVNDWDTFYRYIGNKFSGAGKSMWDLLRSDYWDSGNGSNESEFSVRGSGDYYNSVYENKGLKAYYHSSSQYDLNFVHAYRFVLENSQVNENDVNTKSAYLSVRCWTDKIIE